MFKGYTFFCTSPTKLSEPKTMKNIFEIIIRRLTYMKTVMANAQTVKSEWLLVDVADMPLGRAASQIANILHLLRQLICMLQ